MSLCVVNYPSISSDDFEWIQSTRRQHDSLFFDVVGPHFTIVFPTDGIEESALTEHVIEKASQFDSFDVVLRCAVLGDPSFMGHAHAFLVPDEGFSEVVRLHDSLYTGPLAPELRLDLPFIPHIGVASTRKLDESKVIVDKLNEDRFEIHGRFAGLDIIGYDGKKTRAIKSCALARSENDSHQDPALTYDKGP